MCTHDAKLYLASRDLAMELDADMIHGITLAKDSATLSVGYTGTREMKPGLQSHRFPLQPGPVSASLVRDGDVVASVEGLSPVVEEPYRAMRGTYWISSKFQERFREDAGFAFDPAHPGFKNLNRNRTGRPTGANWSSPIAK